MKIVSLVTKFCQLALGGPVIMTHRVHDLLMVMTLTCRSLSWNVNSDSRLRIVSSLRLSD